MKDPIEYVASGRPLGNIIYANPSFHTKNDCYIDYVNFRLFTNWQGTAPLYLCILSGFMFNFTLVSHYPITPKENTTEWQTIKIPTRQLRLKKSQLLAIGMLEQNDQNRIYFTIKNGYGYSWRNMTINDTKGSWEMDGNGVPAFTYSVVQYSKSVICRFILS